MNTIEIPMETLKLFCSQDPSRPELHEPFRIGDGLVAVDGRIIVRVPANGAGADQPPHPMSQAVEGILACLRGTPFVKTIPLDTLTVPETERVKCRTCKGAARMDRCNKCDGEGVRECRECSHESECLECGGNGVLYRKDGALPCEDCEGAGHVFREVAVKVGGEHLNSHYLLLLRALPGVEFSERLENTLSPVPFRFDGGDGVLMPMRIQ